jgi:hypothetical protein
MDVRQPFDKNSPHAYRSVALLLEHLHDHRLVRPFAIQRSAAVARYRRKLADRFCGVLLSGPRKSHWLPGILCLPAENHPGDSDADSLRYFCVRLFRRSAALELFGVLRMYPGRGDVRFLGKSLARERVAGVARCARGARRRLLDVRCKLHWSVEFSPAS